MFASKPYAPPSVAPAPAIAPAPPVSYAGFDAAGFPGQAFMAWLRRHTRLRWCGFYLGPAPSHAAADWMPWRAALLAQGWGLAPIYVGQQVEGPGSHDVAEAQGAYDGSDAAGLMDLAGFPLRSVVYLDLENGPPLGQAQAAYIGAWCDGVSDAGYTPGLYGSHLLAEPLRRLRPGAVLWLFKVPTTDTTERSVLTALPAPPMDSGFPAATRCWQLAQNVRLMLPAMAPAQLSGARRSILVDLDVATVPDPSAAPA